MYSLLGRHHGQKALYRASFLKCRQCLCLGVLRKDVFTGRVTPSGCAILDPPSPARSAHLGGCHGLPLVHDTFLGECPAQKSRDTLDQWKIRSPQINAPVFKQKYLGHFSGSQGGIDLHCPQWWPWQFTLRLALLLRVTPQIICLHPCPLVSSVGGNPH